MGGLNGPNGPSGEYGEPDISADDAAAESSAVAGGARDPGDHPARAGRGDQRRYLTERQARRNPGIPVGNWRMIEVVTNAAFQ